MGDAAAGARRPGLLMNEAPEPALRPSGEHPCREARAPRPPHAHGDRRRWRRTAPLRDRPTLVGFDGLRRPAATSRTGGDARRRPLGRRTRSRAAKSLRRRPARRGIALRRAVSACRASGLWSAPCPEPADPRPPSRPACVPSRAPPARILGRFASSVVSTHTKRKPILRMRSQMPPRQGSAKSQIEASPLLSCATAQARSRPSDFLMNGAPRRP